MNLSPLVKQMFVATSSQLASISMGGTLGYPLVLIHQFQSNETTIQTDIDTMSWIASMHGVSGIGATVMPTIMQIKGRKYTFIGSCLLLLIGWILAFAAMDAATLIWSAAFHGLASNCITVVNLVTISEMLAAKYRSACMILLLINQSVGLVLVSYLGIYLDWRTDALIMCGPIVLAIVMAFIWPESPSWLAYKGKFEDSKAAFKWLRGTNDEATAELQALIAAQKESRKTATKKTKLQGMLQQLKMKDFYIPMLCMFLILFNFYSAGGIALFIYCQDTIKMGTSPEIAVLGYLLTMCVGLFGTLLSVLLIKYLKSKTIMSTSFGCSMCLFSMSLISYLRTVGVIPKDSLLFLYLFFAYIFFSGSGLTPISFTLAIELVPVKHRGIGGALFNIISCLLNVVTVKSFPYMVLYINLSVTLLIFAVCNLICTILIFIYVPETKNRTLQEIEDYYNFGTFVKRRVSKDSELKVPMIMESNIVN